MAKKPCKVTLKSGGKLYPMNMAEFMTELKNGLLQKLIDEGSISESRLGVREQITPPIVPPIAPPIVPPIVPPIEDEGASKKRKALLNKAYEGSDKDIKAEIKKYGLDYDVESRTDAREKAKNFIEAVGFETALEAVRLSQLDDGAAAYVFAELIDTIEQEMMSASTPEEMNSLRTFQASLINEFDKKARSAGRFVSSLADIYQNSLFNYSAERKINEYKEKNGGYISQEAEEKIRKAAQEIKDLNEKIEELKKKIKEQEDKDNIATIVQSTKQKTEAKVTNTQRAKKLADAFRQLKTKPITFKDSNGNPINTAGITWNDLVEIGARAIEATGRIADGIAAVMDKISEQDWYKRLSQGDKDAIQAQVEGMFTEETPGDINIPAGVIRSLVESGIDTIDGLVAAVRPLIAESYPDATDRDIRDAITGYAKEKKKTRDDIVSEIAKLKRVGKLMSELEDLRSGIEKERDERRKAQKTETEKELLRQIDEMLDALGIKEKRRTERSKRAAQKRIEQLEERIRNGDFSKTKPSPVVEDSELARLRARRQELQDDIDTEIYRAELENRKPIQKFLDYIMELWSLPRALMATGEWSFMLIQGGIQTIAHPINASRALYKTLQHLVSEKKAPCCFCRPQRDAACLHRSA